MLMLLKPACLALTLTLTTAGQSEVAESPFPPSSAIAEGVSPDELSKLSDLIQSFVDDEEIVGGELLVIKNGNSILHQAYGWNDREEDKAMEIDTLFCVRSMTKPFIGVSILMLIDDDLLEYDDPVSKYLPAFDVEGTSEITIEQLLTHTSGLPMSLLLGKDLKQMHEAGGIQAVAELGAGHELQFEPGTDFNYSDQGTDTLTAVIEVVTGGSAASFVETRILEPLGMSETLCVLEKDHPLLARGCSKYVGSRGQWSRYWSPEEERLFPFFLGSQGMYSTLTDYARFLNFWKRKGRASKKRLLGLRYARKAMTSSGYQVGGTGFPGLLGEYGCLLQLWTGPGEAKKEGEEAEREVVVLGHTGSDGTHAWLFPEQDAMVLYFTQSRNGQTAMQVEEQLGSLLLGVPFDPNQAAPPFEDYMGYYWEGEGDLYRSIVRDGEDLALEVVGRGIVPLSYLGEDRWKLRPNPSVVLAFDRSEDGVVIGYHIDDHIEYRFQPSEDLPSLEEIAAGVAKTHRIDLMESVGPIRMNANLEIPKLSVTADVTSVMAWPNKFRFDSIVNDGLDFENVSCDGTEVWYASKAKAREAVTGPRVQELRTDSPLVRFGDWSKWYPSVEVIQKYVSRGHDVVLVRMGDSSATAATIAVRLDNYQVDFEARIIHMDQMGRIGQFVGFGDYRDVFGMQLPYMMQTKIANPLIGEIDIKVESYELAGELPEGIFTLSD